MKVSSSLRQNVFGWLLISPFALSLILFFLYALIKTIAYSFTSYDLFNEPKWVGLRNYISLFTDPLFFRALANTFSFSIIVTLIQTTLALLLAVALNAQIKAKGFFRTVYYIPSIMSSAAVTLIFVWVYQKNGFLNQLLGTIAGNQQPLLFFAISAVTCQLCQVLISRRKNADIKITDPFYALISVLVGFTLTIALIKLDFIHVTDEKVALAWLGTRDLIGPLPLTLWAVVIQNIFTTVPTLMLLFLAGLQGISDDLYESASVDGANAWQQLWHITVPQLAPVTFVVITMGIIGTLQMFDQVALLGSGVPLESRITLAFYVYHYAFPDGTSPQIGIASASALVLGMLTLVLVFIQKRIGIKEQSDG